MKVEISDTDHARLKAMAEERGQTDVSQVITDVLKSYFEIEDRKQRERFQEGPRQSRWAKLASYYRENPSLPGQSEKLNEIVQEFREEFSL